MPKRPNQQPKEIEWANLLETALTAPGHISDVYTRFHNYSFMNQILLLSQGVLEPVATYNRWQDMDRQVLKGSKAYGIVRPIIIEKKNEAGDVEERIKRYKVVKALFGISQTEGKELPPAEPIGWDLDTAHQNLDIRRGPFESLNGNMQGYSFGREYALNPVAGNPTKTTFHELGHIVLGHTTDEELEEYQAHRGVKEFQAEATSYLTMNELGVLDETAASESRGYVQSWLGGERPEDVAIREVFVATDTILKAGRLAVDGT